MPQQIVYTDEKENKIVEKLASGLSISKADAIKKMIREFPIKEVLKDESKKTNSSTNKQESGVV